MAAPRRLWVRLPRSALALFFFLAFGVGGLILGCLFFPPLMHFRARRAMRALVRACYRLFVGAGRLTGLFRVVLSPQSSKTIYESGMTARNSGRCADAWWWRATRR